VIGRVRTSGLATVLVLMGAALGACGGQPSTVGEPTRAPVTFRNSDRITLVSGGTERELGDRPVLLAADVSAGIRITPIPGVSRARLLTLALTRPTGTVRGAEVLVDGHMRGMDHGSFRSSATSSSDGRYVAALPLAMAGEWLLHITVTSTPGTGELYLDLDTRSTSDD